MPPASGASHGAAQIDPADRWTAAVDVAGLRYRLAPSGKAANLHGRIERQTAPAPSSASQFFDASLRPSAAEGGTKSKRGAAAAAAPAAAAGVRGPEKGTGRAAPWRICLLFRLDRTAPPLPCEKGSAPSGILFTSVTPPGPGVDGVAWGICSPAMAATGSAAATELGTAAEEAGGAGLPLVRRSCWAFAPLFRTDEAFRILAWGPLVRIWMDGGPDLPSLPKLGRELFCGNTLSTLWRMTCMHAVSRWATILATSSTF